MKDTINVGIGDIFEIPIYYFGKKLYVLIVDSINDDLLSTVVVNIESDYRKPIDIETMHTELKMINSNNCLYGYDPNFNVDEAYTSGYIMTIPNKITTIKIPRDYLKNCIFISTVTQEDFERVKIEIKNKKERKHMEFENKEDFIWHTMEIFGTIYKKRTTGDLFMVISFDSKLSDNNHFFYHLVKVEIIKKEIQAITKENLEKIFSGSKDKFASELLEMSRNENGIFNYKTINMNYATISDDLEIITIDQGPDGKFSEIFFDSSEYPDDFNLYQIEPFVKEECLTEIRKKIAYKISL